MRIRTMVPADVDRLAAGFAAVGWPGKPTKLFQRYLDEQVAGQRAVWVADHDDWPAGYGCVVWSSGYGPFHDAGIPEIVDLNVLPAHRRRGAATALLDAAEGQIATRSAVAGIGCGLYADYGPALLLYLRRGYLPDGRGIAYNGRTVPAGDTIRLDDSAALMLTKALRHSGLRPGPRPSLGDR
jgi:GNAT superfamily N-acetyltransferase